MSKIEVYYTFVSNHIIPFFTRLPYIREPLIGLNLSLRRPNKTIKSQQSAEDGERRIVIRGDGERKS